jgi:hypothetical protein
MNSKGQCGSPNLKGCSEQRFLEWKRRAELQLKILDRPYEYAFFFSTTRRISIDGYDADEYRIVVHRKDVIFTVAKQLSPRVRRFIETQQYKRRGVYTLYLNHNQEWRTPRIYDRNRSRMFISLSICV